MPKKPFQTLTEPMYYVLLVLEKERYGVEIMRKIGEISEGRVSVTPGTLYAMLGKFLSEGLIEEIGREERKVWYRRTKEGEKLLEAECERLEKMLEDKWKYMGRKVKI